MGKKPLPERRGFHVISNGLRWPFLRKGLVLIFLLGSAAVWLRVSSLTTTDSKTAPPAGIRHHRDDGMKIPSRRRNAQCPELWEAHKFVVDNKVKKADFKVSVLQLVGDWSDPHTDEVMLRVHSHNKRAFQRHGMKATKIVKRPENVAESATFGPAFWKMNATLSACRQTQNNNNLLLFLDGDVVVMDTSARIDALWMYTVARHERDISLLFARDRHSFNSGIFLVNCSSRFTPKFLEAWDYVARTIFEKEDQIYSSRWYEQNAIHFMLQTDEWVERGLPVWNETKFGLSSERFSTSRLRHRILTTKYPCSLQTYPLTRSRLHNLVAAKESMSLRAALIFTEGQFMLHAAGLNPTAKLRLLEPLVNGERNGELPNDDNTAVTLYDSSKLYLKEHDEKYDYRDPPIVENDP